MVNVLLMLIILSLLVGLALLSIAKKRKVTLSQLLEPNVKKYTDQIDKHK